MEATIESFEPNKIQKAKTHAGFNDTCNQIVKSMIISFHSVATSSEHKI
jgi:copper oxidase (laccase) domain-containing protein